MAKVIIVGMGAMGSVYAALMQDAGHEVHGVCKWPDHVEAIQRDGLRVHGFSGDRTVRLASVSTDTDGLKVADLVIIATKATDAEAAAASAKHLIARPRSSRASRMAWGHRSGSQRSWAAGAWRWVLWAASEPRVRSPERCTTTAWR